MKSLRIPARALFGALALCAVAAGVAPGADEVARVAPVVFGEYVEARTCDVWTGPCFANSELNTTGEFAVLGWAVDRGAWGGQDLAGLKLAAAVRARGTLSSRSEGEVRAIVFVDRRATDAQAKALVAMGRKLAPKYFARVVDVRRADIDYTRSSAVAKLEIKDTLKIETKPLDACCDTLCGNEEVSYPTLSKTERFICAKTVSHFYEGDGLRARWSDPHKRSAMLGTFSL